MSTNVCARARRRVGVGERRKMGKYVRDNSPGVATRIHNTKFTYIQTYMRERVNNFVHCWRWQYACEIYSATSQPFWHRVLGRSFINIYNFRIAGGPIPKRDDIRAFYFDSKRRAVDEIFTRLFRDVKAHVSRMPTDRRRNGESLPEGRSTKLSSLKFRRQFNFKEISDTIQFLLISKSSILILRYVILNRIYRHEYDRPSFKVEFFSHPQRYEIM